MQLAHWQYLNKCSFMNRATKFTETINDHLKNVDFQFVNREV